MVLDDRCPLLPTFTVVRISANLGSIPIGLLVHSFFYYLKPALNENWVYLSHTVQWMNNSLYWRYIKKKSNNTGDNCQYAALLLTREWILSYKPNYISWFQPLELLRSSYLYFVFKKMCNQKTLWFYIPD